MITEGKSSSSNGLALNLFYKKKKKKLFELFFEL